MMQKVVSWAAPAIGVLAVIVGIFLGDNGWGVISYLPNMPVEGGKVAGALFVVAVFLERALSVINDLIFGPQSTDLESKLRTALLSNHEDRTNQVANALWELDALSDDKQRLRLGLGFLASIFIAGAGVRTFSGLLNLTTIAGNQRTLLDTMDILLTAGLLAGGSNGLAKIIEIFAARAKANGEQARLFPQLPDPRTRRRLVRAGLAPGQAGPAQLPLTSAPLLALQFSGDVDDLDLAENAKTSAIALKAQFPSVVFTSGRRTVEQQANAMATNILGNRNWVKDTYAQSAERDALQAWVDANPTVTTKSGIANGLSGIMDGWTTAQLVKLSRHFSGLAFDVQPTSDTKLKDAIKALPNLVKFLDTEGGKTIWHAEFSAGDDAQGDA